VITGLAHTGVCVPDCEAAAEGKVVTQLRESGRTFFGRTRTLVDDDYELRA
jgi:hypothetical protein